MIKRLLLVLLPVALVVILPTSTRQSMPKPTWPGLAVVYPVAAFSSVSKLNCTTTLSL